MWAEINLTRSELTINLLNLLLLLRRPSTKICVGATLPSTPWRFLNPGSRGLLLDPFNGIADIKAKVLRGAAQLRFLRRPDTADTGDPVDARFHWPLERTQARYDSAKENNYIEYIGKRSIGAELEQLAHEDDPSPSCVPSRRRAG